MGACRWTYHKGINLQIVSVDTIGPSTFAIFPELGLQLRVGHGTWCTHYCIVEDLLEAKR